MHSIKPSPRCEPWNYVANPKEAHELERLKNLRSVLAQSKKAFEEDKGILLTKNFFSNFKK